MENRKWLEEFIRSREQQKRQDYKQVFGLVNLASAGFNYDAATGILPVQDFRFYGGWVGATGVQGFAKMTGAETSIRDQKGGLSSTQEYIAMKQGILLHDDIPLAVKRQLNRRLTFRREMGESNKTEYGLAAFWPCDFGIASASVATAIAGAQIDFAKNGNRPMVELPNGAELGFAANDAVNFVGTLTAPIYLTTDGGPAKPDGSNLLTECIVGHVMEGWFYEAVQN